MSKGEKEIIFDENVIINMSKVREPQKIRGSQNHSGENLLHGELSLVHLKLYKKLSLADKEEYMEVDIYIHSLLECQSYNFCLVLPHLSLTSLLGQGPIH